MYEDLDTSVDPSTPELIWVREKLSEDGSYKPYSLNKHRREKRSLQKFIFFITLWYIRSDITKIKT